MFSAILTRYPLSGLLLIQLLAVIIVALAAMLQQQAWGIGILAGALCFWLPNALFGLLIALLALRQTAQIAQKTVANSAAETSASQLSVSSLPASNLTDSNSTGEPTGEQSKETPVSGDDEEQSSSPIKVNWWLALSEAIKISVSFALLLGALIGLHLSVIPLMVGWLLMLMLQTAVPVIMNSLFINRNFSNRKR